MRSQAVVLLAAILSVAFAFPDGAGVCTNSAQDRTDVFNQMGTLTNVGNRGPFSVSTLQTTWYMNPNPDTDESGADVEVRITSETGANFNGFLLYATDAGGNKQGQWLTTSTQTVNGNLPATCKSMGHTLTHRDIAPKGGTAGEFVATWRPPLSTLGNAGIYFHALMMVAGAPRQLYTYDAAAPLAYGITRPYQVPNVVATPRWRGISVAFPRPATGGATIELYEARAQPRTGGSVITVTGTLTPLVFDALTNGVQYNITVRARNSVGYGELSAVVAQSMATPGCFCFGHSTTCDTQGVCQNCQGNTQGTLCDVCTPPYRGDPTIGDCGIPSNPSSAYAGPATTLALLVALVATLF